MPVQDTLIVGAGPTGLAMAIELLRAKLPVRLIDKSPHPAQYSQALVVQARTLEQFQRYGIAEAAIAKGRKLPHALLISEGKTLISFNFDRIPGRFPFVLFLPQSETERIMTEHLQSLDGKVERQTELLSFRTEEDDVTSVLRRPDGSTEHYVSRWLIGCDGAHSTVREQLCIPFEGEKVGLTFNLADLKVDGPDAPGDEFRIYLHHGDVVFIGRLTDKLCRVITVSHEAQTSRASDTQLTLADFQNTLDRVGLKVKLSSPVWMTPFYINQRKADHYREGNIFIAGDAAHIHSPVAGQGMNTGIQDSANLGWKVAAVANCAPTELLETYNEERGAVGEALLRVTSRGLAAATTANPIFEKLRDIVLPLLSRIPQVQKEMAGFVSETAIHYRNSSLVEDHGGDGSLRAGDRMPDPDIPVNGGRTEPLLQPLREPKHLLIGVNVEHEEIPKQFAPKANFRFLKTTVENPQRSTNPEQNIPELLGQEEKVLIIRPDGYIGFRARISEGYDPAKIGDYARRVGLF